jgi:hypothetical protein
MEAPYQSRDLNRLILLPADHRRLALQRQRGHLVEIGHEPQIAPERLAQPMAQCARNPRDERHHSLPIERAVRLGVVGIGVVAGNAQEHRRHAEGERDLARGAMYLPAPTFF